MTNQIHQLGNQKEIYSSAIKMDGYLMDNYGGKTNLNGMQFPSYSFDLNWKPMPNAVSYALLLEDWDAMKVIGFPFVHWVVLNIKNNHLMTNASFLNWKKWKDSQKPTYHEDLLWQGYNSATPETIVANNKEENSALKGILPMLFTAQSAETANLYFGPYPPNSDHTYTLYLYGLNVPANQLTYLDQHQQEHTFNQPYYVGDFIQGINNHVVGYYVLSFKYPKI